MKLSTKLPAKPHKIYQIYGLDTLNEFLKSSDNFFCGVECECESFQDVKNNSPYMYWEKKEDHSLRNNGVEFISKPLNFSDTLTAFKMLHENYIAEKPSEKFSDRCSIHVHVNCMSLTEEQVENIILLYALYEPFFFEEVAESRKANIHCVPLSNTMLPSQYGGGLRSLVGSWGKYSALNAKPISTFGTLEFRHSDGHDDPHRFARWLGIIRNLWIAGQQVKVDSAFVNDVSKISNTYSYIFGKTPPPNLIHQVSDSLIDIKLSLI